MSNSYLIDFFLCYSLLIWITFSVINIKQQLADLNQRITADTLVIAMNDLLKIYLPFSLLPISIILFLLWRFYAVMIFTQSWGAGGCGLLIILGVYSIGANLLQTMLFCIRHSRYVTAPKPKQTDNKQANPFGQLLASNQPMNNANFADNTQWG